MILEILSISLLFATLCFLYSAIRVLGEANPRTLFISAYGFVFLMVITFAAILYSVNDYDIYPNGDSITRAGIVLNDVLFFAIDIKSESIICLSLITLVVLPQVFADFVTGLAGVSPGRVRFGWIVRTILSLLAKSMISFAAIETAILSYFILYNVQLPAPNLFVEDVVLEVLVLVVAAAGIFLLALCVDAKTYTHGMRVPTRKLRRRWIRFAIRNRRRIKYNRSSSLLKK